MEITYFFGVEKLVQTVDWGYQIPNKGDVFHMENGIHEVVQVQGDFETVVVWLEKCTFKPITVNNPNENMMDFKSLDVMRESLNK